MTTPTEFRAGLTSISQALAGAMQNACASEKPYITLTGHLDQIRAFVEGMADKVTEEPAGELVASASGLLCFGCILQAHAAAQQGMPAEQLPAVAVAEFVVEGRSLARCHLQLQNGPVIPGRTASGIILGNGNTPPQMSV